MTDTAAPRPPLGIGQIFSETFSIFFKRFLTFFVIAAIPSLVLNAMSFAMIPNAVGPVTSGQITGPGEIFTAAYFIYLLIAMVVGFVLMGVLTLAAYDAKLGRPTRLGVYISRALGAILPIFVLSILFYILLTLGLILLIIPGLYVIGRFRLFVPAILVDSAGFGGLGRASELSQGYRWPIIGAMILLFILIFGLSLIAQLALGVVLFASGALLAGLLVQGLVSALIYAFGSIFTAVVFARLKEIKEGVSVDDLVAVFE